MVDKKFIEQKKINRGSPVRACTTHMFIHTIYVQSSLDYQNFCLFISHMVLLYVKTIKIVLKIKIINLGGWSHCNPPYILEIVRAIKNLLPCYIKIIL